MASMENDAAWLITLIVPKYKQNQTYFVFLSFRVPRMKKDDKEFYSELSFDHKGEARSL